MQKNCQTIINLSLFSISFFTPLTLSPSPKFCIQILNFRYISFHDHLSYQNEIKVTFTPPSSSQHQYNNCHCPATASLASSLLHPSLTELDRNVLHSDSHLGHNVLAQLLHCRVPALLEAEDVRQESQRLLAEVLAHLL